MGLREDKGLHWPTTECKLGRQGVRTWLGDGQYMNGNKLTLLTQAQRLSSVHWVGPLQTPNLSARTTAHHSPHTVILPQPSPPITSH